MTTLVGTEYDRGNWWKANKKESFMKSALNEENCGKECDGSRFGASQCGKVEQLKNALQIWTETKHFAKTQEENPVCEKDSALFI